MDCWNLRTAVARTSHCSRVKGWTSWKCRCVNELEARKPSRRRSNVGRPRLAGHHAQAGDRRGVGNPLGHGSAGGPAWMRLTIARRILREAGAPVVTPAGLCSRHSFRSSRHADDPPRCAPHAYPRSIPLLKNVHEGRKVPLNRFDVTIGELVPRSFQGTLELQPRKRWLSIAVYGRAPRVHEISSFPSCASKRPLSRILRSTG